LFLYFCKSLFPQIMIISIQNQKGGVGKTTLAVHLSHALSLKGSKVLLLDADPQGSARDWIAAREGEAPFAVLGMDRPTIHRDLPAIARDYDHVIIDGPPRVTDLAKSAIAAADMVVIPIQPSPYDVWAAQAVIDLIREVSVLKETLISVFLVNRKIKGTAIGRDVAEALSEFGIPVMKSAICQRVLFAESAASGQTVFELEPKGTAAKEVNALVKELLELSHAS
jgi:chromosome partitioning protein